MKRALVVAGVALATVMGANAYAYTVGVVDIQKILGSEHGINKIQSALGEQFSGERNKLQMLVKQLQTHNANFEKNKAVMSKADAAKQEDSLKKEANQVQLMQAQFQQKYMQAQQTAMKGFVDNIKSAATKVAESDKLDAVFIDNSLLYAKDSKDVTSEVLAKMQ